MKKITKVLSVFLALVMMMGMFTMGVNAEEITCEHVEGEPVVENYVGETCTADGSYDDVVYCTVCGEELARETIPVDAAGHQFGSWIISKDESCSETGIKVRQCSVCQYIDTDYISASGHEFGDGVVTEATCGQEGCTTYTCEKCHATKKENIVPALAHEYGEWTVVTAATCTADGLKEKVCANCNETADGHIVTEAIPATGHDMLVEDVKEPTYTEEGYTVYKCSVCGETENKDFTPVLSGRVKSVSFAENIVINYEEAAELKPIIEIGGSVGYTVAYSSSAENVASIDENGYVTGNGMGKATITCTVTDDYGNVETCTVEVQVKFTMANWFTIIRQVLKAAIDIVVVGIFGSLKK